MPTCNDQFAESVKVHPDSCAVGTHYIVEFLHCDQHKLCCGKSMTAHLLEALENAGFHVIRSCWHQFGEPGFGYTSLLLLSESHAAIHTFPERRYAAFDLFSCGEADAVAVIEHVATFLQAGETSIKTLDREGK